MGANSSIRRNYTHWRLSRKRGNSKLKKATNCPICGFEFKSWQTYDDFNYHIDSCLSENDQSISAHTDEHFLKFSTSNEKLARVREQFNSVRIHWSEHHKKLQISRENLLEDSIQEVLHMSEFGMRSEFQIQFIGENAMDAGGLMKEWVNLLIKELFSEELGLFKRTNTSQVSYVITSDDKDVELYYFTGRILAKAVYENIPVYCPLCFTILKHLLGISVGLQDVECIDSELFNSLVSLAKESLDGTFIGYFALEKGNCLYELKENGSEIMITDENKEEYIELRVLFETFNSMKPGITHFKKGFFSVFSDSILSGLTPDELESLLCGKKELDLKEWKKNTEYKGEFSQKHKVVKWFWEILSVMSQIELENLLMFVTGTSRVPIEGFGYLKTLRGEPAKFTLQSIESGKRPLPQAHTCFNRLEIPVYNKKSEMQDALKYVIKHHSLGFGLE